MNPVGAAKTVAQPTAESAQRRALVRRCSCESTGEHCERCATGGDLLQRAATASDAAPVLPGKTLPVLSDPGAPLDASLANFFARRFDHDFSAVRLHTDAPAAAAAHALDANAFTAGRHVVFGAQRYRPHSVDGMRLLAHELAHVVQQSQLGDPRSQNLRVGDAATPAEAEAYHAADSIVRGGRPRVARLASPMIQRDSPAKTGRTGGGTGPVPQLPKFESFKELWNRFEELRRAGRDREAEALAPGIVSSMMGDDSMAYAGDIAHWLLARGRRDLALQAIENLERAWWIRFVTDHTPASGLGAIWGSLSSPQDLITEAESLAAANDHATARELFGVAYLMLQMQYIALSDSEIRSLNQLAQTQRLTTTPGSSAFGNPMARLVTYSQISSLVADMRKIISFYSVREREATAKGLTSEATRFAGLGSQLRQRIRERYLLSGTGEGQRGVTMEATYGVDRKRGPGYSLHGQRGADEFVTPLPGEPLPDELGSHPTYSAPMEEVFARIGGQEDLLTEVLQQPQIRKRFGSRAIDMNDSATRFIVWNEMLAVFQRQPAAGCPNALCSLLRLIERYLQNFTVHTGYNIDDFGVSYLDRQFPEDLLGRVVRDCGVYAVTVAYEVYRAASSAKPKVPVRLQLFNTLEHFMLVVHDDTSKEHYVVSNDQIVGPRNGNPVSTVATTYAGVMGHPFGISAAGSTQALGIDLSDAAFRNRLWQNYETGARLVLDPGKPPPGDTRPAGERTNEAYKGYYEAMTRFDAAAQAASGQLEQLMASFARLARDPSGRMRTLNAALPQLDRAGTAMAAIIDAIVKSQRIGLRQGPNQPMQRDALLTAPSGVAVQPLARVGKALMFAERNGHTLTADETALLTWLRGAPFPSLSGELTQYDSAGRPAQF